jgi:hypothetical protein
VRAGYLWRGQFKPWAKATSGWQYVSYSGESVKLWEGNIEKWIYF